MFWSVCRKVVCVAVILHRKKVFFQFAASRPNFSLILLKTTFSSLSGYATLFLTICFWEQAFPFFATKTALLTFYLTQTIFWFGCNYIRSCELYVTKSSDLVFCEKTRCFKFHRIENMFWLVDNEIELL